VTDKRQLAPTTDRFASVLETAFFNYMTMALEFALTKLSLPPLPSEEDQLRLPIFYQKTASISER
jgi:hypothetical protein